MLARSPWKIRSLPLLATILSAFICLSSASAQVVPLPFSATGVTLSSAQPEVVFTVDLDTLPVRPRLISNVTPDAPFFDMEVETEWLCDLECFDYSLYTGDPSCQDPENCVFCESPDSCISDTEVKLDVYECSPNGPRAGMTCDVYVRAVSFGGNGSPATVNVEIFGETIPPTDTQEFEFPPAAEIVTLSRDQDTTIYEDSINSNGVGEFIWSGVKRVGNFPTTESLARNGLISFDVAGGSSPIPAGSVINSVELVLEATSLLNGPVSVRLDAVEHNASINPSEWVSGSANGAGDEIDGAFAFPTANWNGRGGSLPAWNTPGGDIESPTLATRRVSTLGPVSFTSPPLTAKVQEMVDTADDRDGFRLSYAFFFGDPFNVSLAVQFASGENGNAGIRPQLIVDFSPPMIDANLYDVTLPFVSEGQEFRWIYDTSPPTDTTLDGILTTSIGGQCVVDFDPLIPLSIPYTYDYGGDPAFQGVDCCTWQIVAQGDPNVTGDEIIGTGQAIFYINVDGSLPENMPGDLDGDGIKDLCDNCMWRANGPALGTCVGGPSEGMTCNTNGQCGTGGICQLSQEDANLDFLGDACLVPEPGFAWMLWSGVGLLVAARRGRPRA